jgi:hypothetical protein
MSKKTTSSGKSKRVTPIGSLTRKTDKTSLNEKTWVVFKSSTSGREPMLYSSKFSRDDVRSAYAKVTGTSFARTRSRRLKNY